MKKQRHNKSIGCVAIPILFVVAIAFLIWTQATKPQPTPAQPAQTLPIVTYTALGDQTDPFAGWYTTMDGTVEYSYRNTPIWSIDVPMDHGSVAMIQVRSVREAMCVIEIDGVEIITNTGKNGNVAFCRVEVP
jgi:hypothetical protein